MGARNQAEERFLHDIVFIKQAEIGVIAKGDHIGSLVGRGNERLRDPFRLAARGRVASGVVREVQQRNGLAALGAHAVKSFSEARHIETAVFVVEREGDDIRASA